MSESSLSRLGEERRKQGAYARGVIVERFTTRLFNPVRCCAGDCTDERERKSLRVELSESSGFLGIRRDFDEPCAKSLEDLEGLVAECLSDTPRKPVRRAAIDLK